MAGMRDDTDEELERVRKSFSGRYRLRDRCYFEMSLQMGLRVSERLSLTVGQALPFGKIVDEVSIARKYMKGTEHYLRSLTDREVWSAFQTSIAAA